MQKAETALATNAALAEVAGVQVLGGRQDRADEVQVQIREAATVPPLVNSNVKEQKVSNKLVSGDPGSRQARRNVGLEEAAR